MKTLLVLIFVLASTQAFAQQREDYCVNPDRKVFVLKPMYDHIRKNNSKVSDIIPRDDVIVAELVAELDNGVSVVVPCPGVNGVSKNRHLIDAKLVRETNIFFPIKNPVRGKTGINGSAITAIAINYETSQVLVEDLFLLVNKRYLVVDVDPNSLRRRGNSQ